jgi:ABC-type transport system involved in multi-copper enzyme maturation permease subunit
MTVLPVAARELRVAARRPGVFRTRVLAVAIASLTAGWIYLARGSLAPSLVGQNLFWTLSTVALAYVLLAGTRATADCLSEEKREGTLGLLFLTDLKGYDVVLGKLAASSVHGFYVVLAILPVLALPLLLGGVSSGLFWRIAAALINVLFFSLSAGILASSLSRDDRRAMYATLGIIFLAALGFPSIGIIAVQYLVKSANNDSLLYLFVLTSPFFTWWMANDAWKLWSLYNLSMGVIFMQSAGMLGLAAWITPRTWQERPVSKPRIHWGERWRQWRLGNAAQRLAFRRHALAVNPVFWLTGRDQFKPLLVWLFLGLIAVSWGLGWAKWRSDWTSTPVAVLYALTLYGILTVWITHEACQQFWFKTGARVPWNCCWRRLCLSRRLRGVNSWH